MNTLRSYHRPFQTGQIPLLTAATDSLSSHFRANIPFRPQHRPAFFKARSHLLGGLIRIDPIIRQVSGPPEAVEEVLDFLNGFPSDFLIRAAQARQPYCASFAVFGANWTR